MISPPPSVVRMPSFAASTMRRSWPAAWTRSSVAESGRLRPAPSGPWRGDDAGWRARRAWRAGRGSPGPPRRRPAARPRDHELADDLFLDDHGETELAPRARQCHPPAGPRRAIAGSRRRRGRGRVGRRCRARAWSGRRGPSRPAPGPRRRCGRERARRRPWPAQRADHRRQGDELCWALARGSVSGRGRRHAVPQARLNPRRSSDPRPSGRASPRDGDPSRGE